MNLLDKIDKLTIEAKKIQMSKEYPHLPEKGREDEFRLLNMIRTLESQAGARKALQKKNIGISGGRSDIEMKYDDAIKIQKSFKKTGKITPKQKKFIDDYMRNPRDPY